MTTSELATTYAEQRAADWDAFVTSTSDLPDYWGLWEERSFGWKVPVDFTQPIGLDHADQLTALQPLLDALRELDEVEVPPVSWLHCTYSRIGFLRPVDIIWSQVESFYVNGAPRARRVDPFSIRLGGVSVADDERIYLGVDDGGTFRELRRLLALGVPKLYENRKDDPLVVDGEDHYVPQIDIGYFTGSGSRANVLQVLEQFRDLEVAELNLTHAKMARMPIQPHNHYLDLDVVAEIPLLGAAHRGGYHN